MGDKLFTLVINYVGMKKKLKMIDPDRYSILDMCDDIKKIFPEYPGKITERLTCSVNGNGIMHVKTDSDVMEMFVVNHMNEEIDIFLEGMRVVDQGEEGDDENEHFDEDLNDGDDCGDMVGNLQRGGGHENHNYFRDEVSEQFNEQNDGLLDDTTSDSDFIANTDEEDNRSEIQLIDSEVNDEELEGYQSDDNCEAINNSDDELKNDPLRGAMDFSETQLPSKPGDKVVLAKGQVYSDVYVFRNVLKDYVMQEGFERGFKNNDKKRVTAICLAKDCEWRIHASLLPDNVSFMVKNYSGHHSCVRKVNPKEASAKWMAEKLIDLLREYPDVENKGIEYELKKYGINPTYMQIYKAKLIAMEKIEGNHTEMFKKMSYYAIIAATTNPSSIVVLQCQTEDNTRDDKGNIIPLAPIFRRFFLGPSTLREGFSAECSLFIGFDGCHLKGPFGGVLLSAIGLDPNNGLYPIAFAVVESECKESWEFFFHNLSRMLGDFRDGKPWTFMTDRQKGLVEVIDDMFSSVTNRKCARHIYANFRDKFAGPVLKKYFWMAARSYTSADFNFAMYKIKEKKAEAYQYLLQIDCSLWSRFAFEKELKNDHVTNNISESFNHWIGALRPKPILTLIDELRAKMMCRLQKRKMKAKKWKNEIVPNVVLKLNLAVEEGRHYHMMMASDDEYQVREKNVHYIVNLDKRTCDCGFWDLTGIPCKHAAVGIMHRRQKLEEYTHPSYSKDMYMRAYNHVIHPITHHQFWPENLGVNLTNLGPPPYKRLPGRPKKSRNRENREGGSKKRSSALKCKRCGGWGHNIRTCKGIQAVVTGQTSQAFVDHDPKAQEYENHAS